MSISDEWIQTWHIYNEMLLGHKKDKILPFTTTRIDLEVMLNEIKRKKTKTVRFHSYVEYKTKRKQTSK